MELSLKEMGSYLKGLRENKHLSTREVYDLVKVSNSYLSLVENGYRRASAGVLKKLASVYDVDYLDLYVKAGYADLAEYEKINKNIQGLDKKTESSAVVFVYGTIPAGVPMECIEDIIDTEEISSDMLKGNKQYFGLKIKGDSMSPEYLDGDTIILEKVNDCESGQDVVVMVNGNDGTFKRFFKNESGIILQPLNPEFQPIVYTNDQIEKLPIRIIGKVVELRRKKN